MTINIWVPLEKLSLSVWTSVLTLAWPAVTWIWRWIVSDLFYFVLGNLHRRKALTTNFLNFGYAVGDEVKQPPTEFSRKSKLPDALPEAINDLLETTHTEEERNQARMYEVCLASIGGNYPNCLEGLDLLEVACGHGGGLRWFQTAHANMKSIRGVDRTVVEKNDYIMQGDADKLPVPDNSVDIVITVEAMHQFSHDEGFINECVRVLRPGGKLLISDTISPDQIQPLRQQLADKGFKLQNERDVTPGVILSRDRQAQQIKQMYDKNFLTKIGASYFWHVMWGVPGTPMYNQLVNGHWIYFIACYQKE